MAADVESKVVDIIADQLNVDKEIIRPDANFMNDLGADSLDTVELLMKLESSFGVKIPEEETENIVTVGDAIACIKEKLGE